MGCCLYYLYTKRDPFDGQNPHEIKNNIRNGKIDRYDRDIGKNDIGEPRHPLIETLLEKCLTSDFDQRPSISELLDLLDFLVINEHHKVFRINEKNWQRLTSENMSCNLMENNRQYANRVINKIVPEFFVKRNQNEPVEIE